MSVRLRSNKFLPLNLLFQLFITANVFVIYEHTNGNCVSLRWMTAENTYDYWFELGKCCHCFSSLFHVYFLPYTWRCSVAAFVPSTFLPQPWQSSQGDQIGVQRMTFMHGWSLWLDLERFVKPLVISFLNRNMKKINFLKLNLVHHWTTSI